MLTLIVIESLRSNRCGGEYLPPSSASSSASDSSSDSLKDLKNELRIDGFFAAAEIKRFYFVTNDNNLIVINCQFAISHVKI